MENRRDSIWSSIDWVTIGLYLALVICGWFSVCGASYDYGDPNFLDIGTRAGKQLMWIVCSVGLGFVILMLDGRLFDTYAYLVYGIMLLLLFGMIFNPHEIKGSRSWIVLGPVSIQPAEFAKFATALALAKFMNEYNFSMQKMKHAAAVVSLIMIPMLLIIAQKETGSALVYLSFFLMLYREGMPGSILLAGVCAVIYFVTGIRFGEEYMSDECTQVGLYAVLSFIMVVTGILVHFYCKNEKITRGLLIGALSTIVLATLFSFYVIPYNITAVLVSACAVLVVLLIYFSVTQRLINYFYIALFTIGTVAFLYSAEHVFNNVLEPHQQVRIKVLLGMEEDLAGAGYNVNQSKIAIGSGGLHGKGFLNGTQTKLKYVPEQDTDFIFCTVGEEQGFVGASFVLLLFMVFIFRLIHLAERQDSRFGRVYGYAVMGVFFFHLFINVGMVLGLTPVIGIPLPFFSYGGSSLWGFTILLFVFLKIDACRKL